jgi:hypothetical protein
MYIRYTCTVFHPIALCVRLENSKFSDEHGTYLSLTLSWSAGTPMSGFLLALYCCHSHSIPYGTCLRCRWSKSSCEGYFLLFITYTHLTSPPMHVVDIYELFCLFTLIWWLLKRETYIVQTIFLPVFWTSSSLHKFSLACRVKSWNIKIGFQTSEGIMADFKWLVCLENSSEILCVTNSLILHSFCSILSFVYCAHVSLSKTETLRPWKDVPWMVQIMMLETGYCLYTFVFLKPTLVYIKQPKEFVTIIGCLPKFMMAQLM